MFTTATPGAQAFSIAKRAASPSKPPRIPRGRQRHHGRRDEPATTLGRAPSIPAATTTRACRSKSRRPKTRCRPATPTSTTSSVDCPRRGRAAPPWPMGRSRFRLRVRRQARQSQPADWAARPTGLPVDHESAGELRQDGGGMLLARSSEQCDVRLITNSGGDHGNLFGRRPRSRSPPDSRVARSGCDQDRRSPTEGSALPDSPAIRIQQRQSECARLDAGNIQRGKSEAGTAYGVQHLRPKRIAGRPGSDLPEGAQSVRRRRDAELSSPNPSCRNADSARSIWLSLAGVTTWWCGNP